MVERELILKELWYRLSQVSSVNYTARNPGKVPSTNDMPLVQIFELEDTIEKVDGRGRYPVYIRNLKVAIEPYLVATDDNTASSELSTMVSNIKNKLYIDGNNLKRLCVLFSDEGASRVIRPPTESACIGITLFFNIKYIEDTAKLY